jgi:hypothetical protein
MVPILTDNALNHFILCGIFWIRIGSRASAVDSLEILVIAIFLIHCVFFLQFL